MLHPHKFARLLFGILALGSAAGAIDFAYTGNFDGTLAAIFAAAASALGFVIFW